MDNYSHQSTIGILYPGEMGSSLGKLLCDAGFRVITTVEGRSHRTLRLCREAGFRVVDSLGALLQLSDVVISLVSPCAALSVATDVAAHRGDLTRRLLYVDANSISPMTVAQIAETLHNVSIDFVDASIFGLASQLRQRGTVCFSGLRANELSHQFGPFLRVKIVGDAPGQASALKMIVSGIPKGLSGLFIETMLFARNMNLLNEAVELCEEIYPNIMEVVNRMLPTYPEHAARRCEELREVEQTMLINGSTPRIVRAVREVTSDLASGNWHDQKLHQRTTVEMVQEIHRATTSQVMEASPHQL